MLWTGIGAGSLALAALWGLTLVVGPKERDRAICEPVRRFKPGDPGYVSISDPQP